MSQSVKVSISIVSHRQGQLVAHLLDDLKRHCKTPLEVILTLNVPEPLPDGATQCGFPVQIVRNHHPKGFAANHNSAFQYARADYFCVLNPDIRICQDPFPLLMNQLDNPKHAIAVPLVLNPAGVVEDSARSFPTVLSILKKTFLGSCAPEYAINGPIASPDWVGGMFMLFRSSTYRTTGGFDEGYFLYYEDVDLCWRLRREGYDVVLIPAVQVVHAAQRASHRNWQHFRWHLSSMLRFFWNRALS